MSISKILLILLAIWGTLVIILGLLKLQIYFPFNIADAEAIPYHRWQTVRFSAFATVIYLIIRYLIGGRPEGALLVVSVFFRFLIIFGAILMWQADVDASEWWVLSFFIFDSYTSFPQQSQPSTFSLANNSIFFSPKGLISSLKI